MVLGAPGVGGDVVAMRPTALTRSVKQVSEGVAGFVQDQPICVLFPCAMSVAAVRGAEAVTPLPLVLRETRVSAADGAWACGLESLAPNPRSFDFGRVPVPSLGLRSMRRYQTDRQPTARATLAGLG